MIRFASNPHHKIPTIPAYPSKTTNISIYFCNIFLFLCCIINHFIISNKLLSIQSRITAIISILLLDFNLYSSLPQSQQSPFHIASLKYLLLIIFDRVVYKKHWRPEWMLVKSLYLGRKSPMWMIACLIYCYWIISSSKSSELCPMFDFIPILPLNTIPSISSFPHRFLPFSTYYPPSKVITPLFYY